MQNINVLILCPHPDEKGGVADYYKLFSKYYICDKVTIEFYHIGSRSAAGTNRIGKTINDLLSLIKIMRSKDLVVFNPSLDPKAVIRDGIFHLLAKRILNKKTLVFFHGWDSKFEGIIDRYLKKIFKITFNFDKALVLARQFKDKLISWGFVPETVNLETTLYEQQKLTDDKDPFKIIFLSRFVRSKGCLEAIQTTEILAKEFPNVKLYMVGEGELSRELMDYVISHNLGDNIEFTGWLEGENKYHLLSQCGIMLFPTSYGEGMPICLIEGMGMGLVIVTRPVAGIPDIIVDGVNGYLVQSLDPSDFAHTVRTIFQNMDVWKTISGNNKRKAKEQFEIRNVVKRLEQLYIEAAQ